MFRLFLVCLGAFAFLVSCSKEPQSQYNNGTHEILPTYFRLTADYTLTETGEDIRFDYVVACGGTATRWTFTSPSIMQTMYPQVMMQATSTGAAVGIRTPAACRQQYWDDGRIPEDFMPTVLWYPDVNDLGLALFFANERAYEGPYARLKFHEASLSQTDQVGWEAWRAKAAEDYEQVGAIPGPWGMSWFMEDEAFEDLVQSRNKGRKVVGALKVYVAEFQLTDEMYADVEEHFRAEKNGRYWAPRIRKSDPVSTSPYSSLFPQDTAWGYLTRKYRRDEDRVFHGGHLFDHARAVSELGVRRGTEEQVRSGPRLISVGGGAISDGVHSGFFHEIYPLFTNTTLIETPEDPTITQFSNDEVFSGLALVKERNVSLDSLKKYWTGQTRALESFRPIERPEASVYTEGYIRPKRPYKMYFNGELMVEADSASVAPSTWFDEKTKKAYRMR